MNWDEYFIGIAKEVAKKSKDPSTKVGALIVDEKNRFVSMGFNGFVAGCDESCMTNERPLKYNLVIHAEMNALIYARRDLTGCKVYCTHAPCDNCLKHLLQYGVREIIYDQVNPYERMDDMALTAILKLIESTDVEIRYWDKTVAATPLRCWINHIMDHRKQSVPVGDGPCIHITRTAVVTDEGMKKILEAGKNLFGDNLKCDKNGDTSQGYLHT